MIRIAQQRVVDLFALAGAESERGGGTLSDRYVGLARRIGMRYNVRLSREQRALYCRGCSVFWVEGRTVRTRLRSGRLVRSCLRCGRLRRSDIHRGWGSDAPGPGFLRTIDRPDGALVEQGVEEGGDLDEDGGEDP